MAKVIVMSSVSVDGFMEGPERSLAWHMVDDELHTHFNDVLRGAGAFMSGRVGYELEVEVWPEADADPEAPAPVADFARMWREKPKYVFSRTLAEAGWNTTVVREVDPEHIRGLKELHGDLYLGGTDLTGAFLRQGLVDELRLYVHPVLVGGGRRLFLDEGGLRSLTLAEHHIFGNGVALLRYTFPSDEK
ncbi:dihydrofolate reductase family protein [Nocardiopsis sp. RSe5-2]|uniref:Dihydrofolate reductase family protein n=1 Tax=Nocardiopsis endophytica TaxID=3018445 RepID=A0ABT4U4M7_9ACTN|nr:dihydrofolate reductase family protein [Nocardiopsis endophytica]MDA2811400.1 dihydrofolate reductase family protein [Nocardiopsis endophytica]